MQYRQLLDRVAAADTRKIMRLTFAADRLIDYAIDGLYPPESATDAARRRHVARKAQEIMHAIALRAERAPTIGLKGRSWVSRVCWRCTAYGTAHVGACEYGSAPAVATGEPLADGEIAAPR